MQAIKLVVDVTPTCWRPPFGDVDDRVRAIAHGLGLRTVLWKYDSNDWRAGFDATDVSINVVDANYDFLLNESAKGSFDTVGAILLAHELNNFTMSEAVKYYERLRSSFKNLVPVAVALNNTQPYVENGLSLGDFDHYTSDTTSSGIADPTGPPLVASLPDGSTPDRTPALGSQNATGTAILFPDNAQRPNESSRGETQAQVVSSVFVVVWCMIVNVAMM